MVMKIRPPFAEKTAKEIFEKKKPAPRSCLKRLCTTLTIRLAVIYNRCYCSIEILSAQVKFVV